MKLPTEGADVLLCVMADPAGWGGGVTTGVEIARSIRSLYPAGDFPSCALVGISKLDRPAATVDLLPRWSVMPDIKASAWRTYEWQLSRSLARSLADVRPPKVAVAVSPFWVLALRQAFPKTPVLYALPGLLSNCIPFTWEKRKAPSFWDRFAFWAMRRAERRALRRASLVTIPAEASHHELQRFAGRGHAPLALLPPGARSWDVNPATRAAAREALYIQSSDPVVLMAGTCDRNKAAELAIETVLERSTSIKLIIAGDGPMRKQWRAIAKKRGVEAHCRFVGVQRDMSRVYAASDIVISTSWYESFGITLADAWLCGRPVVAPRHDPPRVFAGFHEWLERSGGGLTYDRQKPETFISAVKQLVQDPELRASCAEKGRAIAERYFSWDKLAYATLDLAGITPPIARASSADDSGEATPEVRPQSVQIASATSVAARY